MHWPVKCVINYVWWEAESLWRKVDINLSVWTVQVFQMIEETAEEDKMSRQKALLIMERKNFLDSLANISYNDQLSQQVGLQ